MSTTSKQGFQTRYIVILFVILIAGSLIIQPLVVAIQSGVQSLSIWLEENALNITITFIVILVTIYLFDSGIHLQRVEGIVHITFQTSKDKIGYLYAHVSRLYNSGFNALTATIFGLLAYLSIYINNKDSMVDNIGFILVGRIVILMIFYFYYRLIFGRWMERIEEDLYLDYYKYSNMQYLAKFHPDMNQNPSIYPKLTNGEFISLVLLSIFTFMSNLIIILDVYKLQLSYINCIIFFLMLLDYIVLFYYILQITHLDRYKSLAERVQQAILDSY